MDYTSDADPMISAAFMSDYIPTNYQLQGSIGGMEFESFPRQGMSLDGNMDFSLTLDSPVSVDAYSESDLELGFQDQNNDTMGTEDEVRAPSPAEAPSPVHSLPGPTDDKILQDDIEYLEARFAKYDIFPANNNWTPREKAERLLELSPCKKYSIENLVNIDSLESSDDKVDMLIEIVARIKVAFPWNCVEPRELKKAYTAVAKCKKDKKKDANGQQSPKRPMNAFMIWSKKCRSLIAQFAPQLHNATISSKLGEIWREFSKAEKEEYEKEKERLQMFHNYEYPNYKYRPQKKPNKKAEPKPTNGAPPKVKSGGVKKKKQANTTTTASLAAIGQAVAGINVNPKVKAKLQVKIDSELRRGIGKRSTGVHIADLPPYSQLENGSSTTDVMQIDENVDQKKFHFVVDSQPSSVFDTPGNSPHTPITPTDDSNASGSPNTNRNESIFTFDDKSFQLHLELNNNVMPIVTDFTPVTIKTEAADVQQCIYSTATIKMEPEETESSEVSLSLPLPVLSAETVESYFGNDRNEDLNDIMSLLNYAGELPMPQMPLIVPEGPASV